MSWFSSTVQDNDRHSARLDLTGRRPINNVSRRHALARPAPYVDHGLEQRSITDARARVTNRHRGHVSRRRALLSVPAALLTGDVVAFGAQSAIVRGSIADALLFGFVLLVCRAVTRQYRRRLAMSVLDDLPRLLGSTLAAVGVTTVALAVLRNGSPDAVVLIERAVWFVLFATLAQSVVTLAAHATRRRHGGRRTVIVGGGRVGDLLAEALAEHPDLGLDPVGVLDPHLAGARPARSATAAGLPVFGTDVGRLAETVVLHDIETAILALEDGEPHVDTVIALHQTGCETLLVPPLFEMHHDGPDVDRVRGVPLIRLRPDPTMRPSWWVKRSFDIAVATLAVLVLSPLLLAVAAMVLIDSGRPVLFWQERVGLDGGIFRLCKFRSMRPESEAESQTTWNIAKDPRVSKVGHLLRRTSIDEIPQLWNIVRGQMSLVGPRPERPTFVEQFSLEHERYWARHRVPVGLTGLAQVNGLRGDTSIRDRARYDNYYIANWSLWLDVKIMLLTVREVLGGRGR